MKAAENVAATLTRALLVFYPPSFRNEVGKALIDDVCRRARELSGSRGSFDVGMWLIRLGASLLLNAWGAWVDAIVPNRPPVLLRSPGRVTPSIVSWLDFKLALRMLVRFPGLTLVGGLGIAVAVALVVAFFAVFQARFYPTIPLNDGDRLVGLENWDRRTGREERRSLHDFAVWRAEMKSIEDLTAFRTVDRNVIGADGSAEVVQVAEITPSGFRLARVPPMLGRSLADADSAPDASPVIVIGFDVWRSRFASAPDVIGRNARLGRSLYSIVGVMPDGFAFPVNHHFWIPFKADPSDYERGKGPSIFMAGRLAPGFDLDAANAELSLIGHRLATAFPDTHGHLSPEVLPYTYPFAGMSRRSADGFWAMSALATLLLVVVCVNVAILIYARTATRLGEIAVRTALGATRTRIVAQLFAESLILSAGASAAGLLIVKLGLDWARSSMTALGQSAFWNDYTLSGTAFGYFASLALLAAIVTGVVPALRVTGRRVQSDLRQFDSGASLRLGRTWTTLIVFQVAVASAALPLSIALGWFEIRDIFNLPRFPVDQILFAEVGVDRDAPEGQDAASYRATLSAQFARLQTELSRALEAEPGVAGHAFTTTLPNIGRGGRVAIENDPDGPAAIRDVDPSAVDGNFFRTFDVNLLAGRPFGQADLSAGSADVAVVNRAFANRLLGGTDSLGRRIRFVSENPRDTATVRWYEIVGVVEDIDANPFGQELVKPRVYTPLKTGERINARLAVRISPGERGALAQKLPGIAAALDPALQLHVVPLEELYRVQRQALSTAAAGIGVALLSVVLLSAAGIYALISFTIVQRRREIAIRTALGARASHLLGDIFGRALRQLAVGVALGVGAALVIDAGAEGGALAGRGSLLLSGTILLIGAVGLFAALGPARRGLRIEPSEALKAE